MFSRGLFYYCSVALALGYVFAGCSTMTSPVLRNETGETLGAGRPRLRLGFGAARNYPLVGALSPAAAVAQSGVYQGSNLYLQGAIGIHTKADMQLGGFVSRSGGGWRIGSKVHVGKKGPFSIAVMAGYGAYSSGGTIDYLTVSQPISEYQSMSTTVFDLSVPVSIRVLPTTQIYGGLMYFKSSVIGSSGDAAVGSSNNDLGANLGVRVTAGRFEIDGEFAMVSLYDSFTYGSTFVPFYGAAVSFLF